MGTACLQCLRLVQEQSEQKPAVGLHVIINGVVTRRVPFSRGSVGNFLARD
jgi:hypothetical protein